MINATVSRFYITISQKKEKINYLLTCINFQVIEKIGHQTKSLFLVFIKMFVKTAINHCCYVNTLLACNCIFITK